MEITTFSNDQRKRSYTYPAMRIVYSESERYFLASNTEPIDDDGNEHDWD